MSIPSRVLSFIGPDREEFLQGIRAEAQGMGVGAFSYYRRVVDNQWKRILDHLVRASKNINSDKKIIETLIKAQSEDQFGKAVEIIKKAIPPSLLISGHHNPLALLYKATSKGIHNFSDGQCLQLAKDVRVVLTELADRMTKALSDQSELNKAVSQLMKIDDMAEEK